MTLNVTLLTPGYTIQVSDRRMVSQDGFWTNDSANKGLVLQAEDGIFAITFAGMGMYMRQRVDLWLAEMLIQEGGPELPIEEVLAILAEKASAWFSTFRGVVDKRHIFVVCGWRTFGAKSKPVLWAVSNYTGERDQKPEKAEVQFAVKAHLATLKRESVYAFGLHQAVDRLSKRRFQASIRKQKDEKSAEAALVRVVRAATKNPKWSWGINGDVLAIALSPDGQAFATFHPEGSVSRNYAPLFVWHDGGFNFVAGDASIVPTSEFAYRFGRTMLIGQMGGGCPPGGVIPDVEKVISRCNVTQAKFKKSAVKNR